MLGNRGLRARNPFVIRKLRDRLFEEKRDDKDPKSQCNWPLVRGNGFLVVTLAYTYKVADERYAGRESFAFIRDEDAARFENGCKQRPVQVHYRLDKPSVSVLAREDLLP